MKGEHLSLAEIDEVIRHSGNIDLKFKVFDLLDNPTQGCNWASEGYSQRELEAYMEMEPYCCLRCGNEWCVQYQMEHACQFDCENTVEPTHPIPYVGQYCCSFANSRSDHDGQRMADETNHNRCYEFNYRLQEYANLLNKAMYNLGTLDDFDPNGYLFLDYSYGIRWEHNLDDPRLEQWDK